MLLGQQCAPQANPEHVACVLKTQTAVSLCVLWTFSIVTLKVPARCTGQPLPSLETLSDPAIMSQAEAEHPALDAK